MKTFINDIFISLRAIVVLTILLCGIYPLLIWVIGQTFFSSSVNGSLISNRDGVVVGSELIGQAFTDSIYFQPRPSAAGNGYDAAASGGSNLGPLSHKLATQIQDRISDFRLMNHLGDESPIPADAVTASGSGLDPHISIANAMLQAPRVAKARQLDPQIVKRLINEQIQNRQFGFLGESRVNVLKLNVSLDRISQ
jgi:potassium-transporting ATPase KdpC subunit